MFIRVILALRDDDAYQNYDKDEENEYHHGFTPCTGFCFMS